MGFSVDVKQLLGPALLKATSEGEVTKVPTTAALKDKVVGVLFSDGSPSNDEFARELKETYETLKNDNAQFEIVYVKTENSENDFKEDLNVKAWLGAPIDQGQTIVKSLGVSEFPSLLMIMPDGEVACKNARKAVVDDPQGEHFPWTETESTYYNTPLWPWVVIILSIAFVWILPSSLT